MMIFHLRGNSPCLDAGNDAAVPADVTKDYDGDDRILDGDEDGTPAVDMGVDEYRHVPATWHVDGDLPSSGDGTSWAQAFKTLEEALDNPLLRNFDQIWVKQGTYTPPGLGGWSNGAGLTIEKIYQTVWRLPRQSSRTCLDGPQLEFIWNHNRCGRCRPNQRPYALSQYCRIVFQREQGVSRCGRVHPYRRPSVFRGRYLHQQPGADHFQLRDCR